jgi:hypothetical protein
MTSYLSRFAPAPDQKHFLGSEDVSHSEPMLAIRSYVALNSLISVESIFNPKSSPAIIALSSLVKNLFPLKYEAARRSDNRIYMPGPMFSQSYSY